MSSINDADIKIQEAQLLAKYPDLGSGLKSNKLIQKRLNKNIKYFDSGDYNVARDKVLKEKLKVTEPDSMVYEKKNSLTESAAIQDEIPISYVNAEIVNVEAKIVLDQDNQKTICEDKVEEVLKECTGETIPTPDNVPSVVRKKSVLQQPISCLSRSESHSFELDNNNTI